MSVLKSKRKPSQFEVFHHLNKMRKEVTDLLLRDFGYDLDKAVKVYVANSIYPTYREELIERRVHQDRAVGQCYRLTQELQYAIETLPVDVNKYLRFAEMIQTEINLLKGWRKSDNKFKSVLQEGNL